jgi:hypothetical protein
LPLYAAPGDEFLEHADLVEEVLDEEEKYFHVLFLNTYKYYL